MKLFNSYLFKNTFSEKPTREEEIKEKVKFLLNQWVSLADVDKAESRRKLEEAKTLLNTLKQIQSS
ncbi:MAG: hypothetical protein U5K51_11385 [Flavobacteriaceae bacterium]|nr:hypothetical protein [Flavobacteriaceae bacterium]